MGGGVLDVTSRLYSEIVSNADDAQCSGLSGECLYLEWLKTC